MPRRLIHKPWWFLEGYMGAMYEWQATQKGVRLGSWDGRREDKGLVCLRDFYIEILSR